MYEHEHDIVCDYMNKVEQRVKNYIIENNLINENDTVIIGLSGGADSVCLLLVLNKLRTELGINLEAIHVNHGIRGMEADEDEAFVIKLCGQYNIPIKTHKVDIPLIARESHETEEECGRRVRYEIFNKRAQSTSYKIAVAHHMEDQAETVIFRMARGTGVKGIAGMKPLDGKIIRPLLCLHKSEIITYLNECKQEYKIDATNEDTLYSRNLIRKEISPLLERINESAIEHIVSLSIEADKINNYIENQADVLLKKARLDKEVNDFCGKYDVKIISQAEEIIRNIAIRKIIKNADIPLKDITREHIDTASALLLKTEASSVCLPNNNRIVIEAGRIYVDTENEAINNEIIINIDGEGEYPLWDKKVLKVRMVKGFDVSSAPQSPYTKWFDYDKISNDLYIRKRQSGDYLVVGSNGESKSIKKYMIDEKIPKSERDNIPVLVNNHRVAWVIGGRISWDVKITENTKHVIEFSVSEVENG